MKHFDTFKNWIQGRVAKAERGATLVEYALLVALIAVVCIAGIGILSGSVNDEFEDVGNTIADCADGEVYDADTGECGPPA